MAQLSRPYQIGLAAIVLLAAVWLVLLQGHPSSSSSPASSAAVTPASSTPTTAASTNASKAGSQSSAPGVAGLTRAIEKAHGAAAVSQQTNRHLQEKSAQASTPGNTSSTPSSTAAPSKAATPSTAAPTKTATHAASTPSKSAQAITTAPSSTKAKPAAPSVASRSSSPTRQRAVEAQLAKGKVALILFWNPKGADDQEVHKALRKLSAKDIAVNQAAASEIASFGTITRGIQVYGTPTLLIVNKKGEAITLTGPQDSFAIDQAISEARHT